MDPKRARTFFPDYWRGVRKSKANLQMEVLLCGFDTETFFAKIFLSGFIFPDGRRQICYGLKRDHLKFLFDCLFSIPGNATVVCGAHYLIFDLGVEFWGILNPQNSARDRAPKRSHFSLLSHKCEVEIIWGKPCFAKIRKNKRTILIIDTFAFYTMSLKKALKTIGGKVQKEEKPKDLGERLIPLSEIKPYFLADLDGVRALMVEILRLHWKYQASFCVSLPQLSGKIFRHHYMKKDFALPPKPLIAAALLSYHGGKNSWIGKPGWYQGVWDLDINSAYPEAMAQLPNFEEGEWIQGSGIRFVKKHPHGIYRISGVVKKCPWGVVFDHGFKKISGEVANVWTTGYEILEGLGSKEIRLEKIHGYGFRPDDRPSESPFARFVHEFYSLKNKAVDPGERYFYKLILNSLYGKFIQRVEEENPETGEMEFVAGSMCDPVIASLITGYVRAKIHRLEHKYKALHTATDGIMTQVRPDPADLGDEMGKLKQENYGPALILRNKLYLHFDQAGKVKKSGLHGFQGDLNHLEKIWRSSKRIYHISRLTRWAEAWHIGLPPGLQQKNLRRELKLN